MWDTDVVSGNLLNGASGVEAEAFLAVVEAGRLVGDEVPLAVTETLKPLVRVVYIQPGSPADNIPMTCCWNAAHARS